MITTLSKCFRNKNWYTVYHINGGWLVTLRHCARTVSVLPGTSYINRQNRGRLKTVLYPSRGLNELADINWLRISFNWIVIGITTSLHSNWNIRQVQNFVFIACINNVNIKVIIIQINLMVNRKLCLKIIFGYEDVGGGNKMCWWQVWDVGDRFDRRKSQRCQQDPSSVTNGIHKLSPTFCRQLHDITNTKFTLV